jgi:putative resolvase
MSQDQTRLETLPIGKAARLLGVHPNTLRNWTDRGLVPHLRLPSGYRRFTVSQIDEIRRKMGISEANAGDETGNAG